MSGFLGKRKVSVADSATGEGLLVLNIWGKQKGYLDPRKRRKTVVYFCFLGSKGSANNFRSSPTMHMIMSNKKSDHSDHIARSASHLDGFE